MYANEDEERKKARQKKDAARHAEVVTFAIFEILGKHTLSGQGG